MKSVSWGKLTCQYHSKRPIAKDGFSGNYELEEEVGIKATPEQLHFVAKVHAFSTKATESVHLYLAFDCEFNSQQNLDTNEDIEILQFTFAEVEAKILSGEIWDAEAICLWELAKMKFPAQFS